jgi:hypothetical protein
MKRTNDTLILPEFIDPEHRPWEKHETEIRDAAVDLMNRSAYVPKAHTPAQRLARLHELGHVKWSPRNWNVVVKDVIAISDKPPDPAAVLHIVMMLEENRIDWLLWSRRGIDIRPAREVMDWEQMGDPHDLLNSLGWALQLAWTVWASRGLSKKLPQAPPVRSPDVSTGEFFDKHWAHILDTNRDLAIAVVRGCLAMYDDPTHARRNTIAAELATFFPIKEVEREKPKEKPEEREARREAERRDREAEKERDDAETGVDANTVQEGGIQIHDHTTAIRRPSMRIARKRVPVCQGVDMRYAHRYALDGSIFSQRLLTEAGIMIDGSSSMNWTDEDMAFLYSKLPAVQVGLYSGIHPSTRGGAYARICVLAKKGRFSRFTGPDPGTNGGNEADYEALRLLSTWPKPRLWLSDGLVCGGVHSGPPKDHERKGFYNERDGLIHEKCSALMKRHEIYRVPSREIMLQILKRQRVTLYRSTRTGPLDRASRLVKDEYWPDNVKPEPIMFQL